mgnify:CR=1 FL=1
MSKESKITPKEVYYFELCEKDNSQIRTKENAKGFPLQFGMMPVCVGLYKTWDEENKKWLKDELKPQTLRYVEGESEILRSKQRNDIKGAEAQRIYFRDGGLSVTRFEPALLDFMLNHPRNADNPNRDTRFGPLFKIVDKNKAKLEALNEAKVKIEVEAIIVDLFKGDPESIIAVAAAIGVNTEQEAALIEHDMLVRSRRNPKQMMADIGNPLIRDLAQIKIAEKREVIKMTGNVVTWGDGSPTGFSCAENLNTRDEFLQWATNTPEGKKVFAQIKFRLKNPITQL